MGLSVGSGPLGRPRLTSQLPPCLGLCLCSCSLSPECREGAGRGAGGRGQATVALIKNFTPPRGPGPSAKPPYPAGGKPKAGFVHRLPGTTGPHSGPCPRPVQRAGLQTLFGRLLWLGSAGPSWVPAKGQQAPNGPQRSLHCPFPGLVGGRVGGDVGPDTSASARWAPRETEHMGLSDLNPESPILRTACQCPSPLLLARPPQKMPHGLSSGPLPKLFPFPPITNAFPHFQCTALLHHLSSSVQMPPPPGSPP